MQHNGERIDAETFPSGLATFPNVPEMFPLFLASYMKIKVKYLRRLLDALISKYDETFEKKALERIAQKIKGIGGEGDTGDQYLYKKIAQPITGMGPEEQLGLRESKLMALVADLGYDNVKAFINEMDNPYSSQLKSCTGVYYTYLRKNTKEGILLRSPVRIFAKNSKVWMELVGKRLNYLGEMKLQNGYLSVLLQNKNGKQFYHGYKIGAMEQPQVLQGIFSGVTSAFDPIGGRVVLVRVDGKEFNELKIGELKISTMKRSDDIGEVAVAEYLEDVRNNLSINKTTSFGFGDLT